MARILELKTLHAELANVEEEALFGEEEDEARPVVEKKKAKRGRNVTPAPSSVARQSVAPQSP